jgi:hypothetical protein
VGGWFAALLTGRLPRFAGQYLTGFVRWQTRVLAYLLMLTDAYPPFSLADAEYPVRLYTKAARLNRAAILFRIILLVPAAIVSQLAIGGLLAWSFVIWLVALITGTVPESLSQAIAATIRFSARASGYALLLTPSYPAGLFGDRPAATAGTADPWQLVLTGRARALVAGCVATGLLVCAGYGAGAASLAPGHRPAPPARSPSAVPPGASHSANTTLAELRKAYAALMATLSTAQSSEANCGQSQRCVQVAIDDLGGDFASFGAAVGNALQGIVVPAGASAAADDLQYQASQATVEFAILGQATSAAQYRREFKSGGAEQTLNQMSADYGTLISALSARAGAA